MLGSFVELYYYSWTFWWRVEWIYQNISIIVIKSLNWKYIKRHGNRNNIQNFKSQCNREENASINNLLFLDLVLLSVCTTLRLCLNIFVFLYIFIVWQMICFYFYFLLLYNLKFSSLIHFNYWFKIEFN